MSAKIQPQYKNIKFVFSLTLPAKHLTLVLEMSNYQHTVNLSMPHRIVLIALFN